MKKLEYEIEINSPAEKIWEVLTDKEKYKVWAKAFMEGSHFVGEWKQGTEIKFLAPGMGGTLAFLEEVKPYEVIRARHTATISGENRIEKEGSMAEKWIGTSENYFFSEKDGKILLKVEIETHEDFAAMFEKSFPKALLSIKEISES